MEAIEMLETRRSVRKFAEKEIPGSVLNGIFHEAMFAPSWKNTQTVNYLVAVSSEMKEKVRGAMPAFNAKSAEHAAVIVVMLTRKGRSGYERDGSYSTTKEDRWEYFDAGIACQTLCLAAWEQGIASCIMGLYDEEAVRSALNIPEEMAITALIPMGYPDDTPVCPKRKSVGEKVTYV